MKAVSVFAYRLATPRQRFNFKKAFSTRYRYLYNLVSYSRFPTRFLFGGITVCIPRSRAYSTILFVSYPRSAKRTSALIPSISSSAQAQSARVPSVTMIRNGLPRPSTARCILVFSPLSYDSFPDSPRLLRMPAGVLYNGSRLSSATDPPLPLSMPALCTPSDPFCSISDTAG